MTQLPAIKLLIADDHHLVRDGMISLLQAEKDMEIAGTAANGYEVLELAAQKDIHVCLLDINMPQLDGIATARLLRQRRPALKIIVLTTYNDKEIIAELLHIGVAGYLLKNCTRNELMEAIRKVSAGGLYFSNEVQVAIMESYVKMDQQRKREGNEVIILTQREKEILQLLAREYTNEKIAIELNISFRTVETHRKNIMQKTGAHNLAGLLKYAYNNGLIKMTS